MNAYTFLKKYGWKEAEKVAIAAGTTRSYFTQLAHGHRRASVDLAQRLEKESGQRMTLIELLTDGSKSSVAAGHKPSN